MSHDRLNFHISIKNEEGIKEETGIESAHERKNPLRNMMKQVGERLQRRREALDLSKQEVAERLAVAYSTIVRIEAGANGTSFETISAYCKLLGLSLNQLVSEDELQAIAVGPEKSRSTTQILEAVKRALKIAENPRVQQMINMSDLEWERLVQINDAHTEREWEEIQAQCEEHGKLSPAQQKAWNIVVRVPEDKMQGLIVFLEMFLSQKP